MANKKSTTSESKTTTKKSSSAKKTTTKKNTTSKTTTTKTTAKKNTAKKNTAKVTKPVVEKEVKKVEVKETKPVVKEEVKKVETKKIGKKKTIGEWFQENLNLIGGIVIVILLIINIVLIANGHKVKLSNGNEIIASVDGKDFVAEDLFDDLKDLYGSNSLLNLVDKFIISKEIKDDSKARSKAKENLESIRSQYESAGYDWDTVLTQYGYENEDTLLEELMTSVKKEEVAKNYLKENLSDEEINKYYEDEVYGTYSAKHILIKPVTTDNMTDEEKNAAEEAAKNKAQEVINRLNNGEDFASLVKEYSEDEGSVDKEGLVENFTKGDVVDEFFNATAKLKDGEYTTEPVKSSYGYHVILRVSATEKKALKDIKDEVVEKIIEKKLDEDSSLYTKTWVEIRKKYNFTINDTKLKDTYEKSING